MIEQIGSLSENSCCQCTYQEVSCIQVCSSIFQHLHRIFVAAKHCHMQRNPTLNHSCVSDQEQTQPVTSPHLCDLFWLPCEQLLNYMHLENPHFESHTNRVTYKINWESIVKLYQFFIFNKNDYQMIKDNW
ncbi:hypothetical protein HanXRQr2_Chr04g0140551 [Helianthus annuus]|uniref:Uncharacterized protein n=1 Tax=Helianthus annuus TaxID=4232 RepID=A0A9K3J385_HELAN|nr:hypothetical protein HanXRQr2_Chr04g0140551 [Helianthus annuus]